MFGSGFGKIKPAVIFGIVILLLVLILGAVLALVVAPRQDRDRRRIEGYPELDWDGFTAALVGEQLVITGRFQDNSTLTRYELVAFRLDEWDVSRDDDGEEQGDWRTLDINVPALKLEIDGGVIETIAVKSPGMGGDLREFIEHAHGGTQASYNGESLSEGSIRIQGFRNRDLVTVVGKKTAAGELRPDRLHAGDRPSLVQDLRADVLALRIIGAVMMGIGLLALAVIGWRATKDAAN